MKRPDAFAQIFGWLCRSALRSDFGVVGSNLLVVRRPGAATPICLVPIADHKRPSSGERVQHAKLRDAGITIVVVRSAIEAEMAMGPKLLAELRQRKANAEERRAALLRVANELRSIVPVQWRQPRPAEFRRAA